MAKREISNYGLEPSTKVELIAIDKKTKKAYKKIINYGDFKNNKTNKDYNYYTFEIGFSQFKDAINV